MSHLHNKTRRELARMTIIIEFLKEKKTHTTGVVVVVRRRNRSKASNRQCISLLYYGGSLFESQEKKRVAFSLFLFDILHLSKEKRNDNVTITFAKSTIQSSKVPIILPMAVVMKSRKRV